MKIGDKVIVVDKGELDELQNGEIFKIQRIGEYYNQKTYSFSGYFVYQKTLASPDGTFKVLPLSLAIQIMFGVSNEN